jgi:diketogulonate reductase-like aldo/keto reductase
LGNNLAANIAIVEHVDALAASKGCTPAQVALAWVHAQGRDFAPIPGTKRRRYLEDNVGALDVVLSDDDLASLNALGDATETVMPTCRRSTGSASTGGATRFGESIAFERQWRALKTRGGVAGRGL